MGHQKPFIRLQISDHHAQQIIRVTGHQIAFHDFRTFQDHILEIFERGAEGKQALFLLAVMESTLEDIEEGVSSFDYSPAELKRLRELRDQAREAAEQGR